MDSKSPSAYRPLAAAFPSASATRDPPRTLARLTASAILERTRGAPAAPAAFRSKQGMTPSARTSASHLPSWLKPRSAMRSATPTPCSCSSFASLTDTGTS